VERERYQDAERGLKIAQVLEGHIHRKVIKQTVMTTVYGVTRFGARLQIARQLKGKYRGYMLVNMTSDTVNWNVMLCSLVPM
jgi:DNA-directed RNA polymerase